MTFHKSSDQIRTYRHHRRVSICTWSLREFAPLAADPRAVALVDIAQALGQKCRYTGHTGQFYSVAQHSVYVSLYLEERLLRPDLALAGMFHDAAEAYLPDVASPLKRELFWKRGEDFVPFHEVEDEVLAAVDARFGLPGLDSEEVKIADDEVFRAEVPVLFDRGEGPPDWWGVIQSEYPAFTEIPYWNETRSSEEWLARATMLLDQREDAEAEEDPTFP